MGTFRACSRCSEMLRGLDRKDQDRREEKWCNPLLFHDCPGYARNKEQQPKRKTSPVRMRGGASPAKRKRLTSRDARHALHALRYVRSKETPVSAGVRRVRRNALSGSHIPRQCWERDPLNRSRLLSR